MLFSKTHLYCHNFPSSVILCVFVCVTAESLFQHEGTTDYCRGFACGHYANLLHLARSALHHRVQWKCQHAEIVVVCVSYTAQGFFSHIVGTIKLTVSTVHWLGWYVNAYSHWVISALTHLCSRSKPSLRHTNEGRMLYVCWFCHSVNFTSHILSITCLFPLKCRLILICVGSNARIVASGFADHGKTYLCLSLPWLTPWKGLVFPALHSFIIYTKCFLWQYSLYSPCRQQEEESFSDKLPWIR